MGCSVTECPITETGRVSVPLFSMGKRKFGVGNTVDILTWGGDHFSTGIVEKWQWGGDSGEFAYYVVSLDRKNQMWVYESGLTYAQNPQID